MTDVEPKISNKRKSFGGKKESPKKPKLENVQTPKKVQTPQKQKTPQEQKAQKQKTPNQQKASESLKTPQQNKSVQNSVKKSNKKQKKENGSPAKSLKPFGGTAQIESPKVKQEKAIKKEEKPSEKKRRKPFFGIKEKLNSKDEAVKQEVAKSIEAKLKLIQARSELSKSALRRMKRLRRLQRIATGEQPPPPPQKQPNAKGEASKRRERRKKAAANTATEEVVVKKENSNNKVQQGAKKAQQVKAKNQKAAKKVPVKAEPESEEDSDEEENEVEPQEENDSGDEEDDSGEEEEVSGDEEEDDESDEEEESEDDDEESEDDEEVAAPPQAKKQKTDKSKPPKAEKNAKEPKNLKEVDLDDLKKNDFVAKNQKRYVVFVGNIPYDTTKQDLLELFQKCGEIKHVRIPTEKKGDRPRGFAYVEAANEETYQKCLSKHHSFLKGRRINVLYTQSGKKKGDDKKKEIKAKNFKLDALRKKGILLGSKKESQRRSFRRKKQHLSKNAGEEGS
ncbi:uncharacterized protein [Leptinotarsa decemlineata]|uniref:uncharacterized protein n=1 Tax=Leptinotarsa decemlineata TaxID=7539 RepID=UPI003D30A87C